MAVKIISYCYCNTLPQRQWFKIAQIYHLTVLEVQSLKWVSLGKNQGVSLPAALGENPFLCHSQLLEAACLLDLGSFSSSKPAVAGQVLLSLHHDDSDSSAVVAILKFLIYFFN